MAWWWWLGVSLVAWCAISCVVGTCVGRVLARGMGEGDDAEARREEAAGYTERMDLCKLCVLSYSKGFTLWRYGADVDEANKWHTKKFWAPAFEQDLLTPGDMIMVSTARMGKLLLVGDERTVVEMAGAHVL